MTVESSSTDYSSLSWTNKRDPIRISYCGSEDFLQRNRKFILDALGNGSLQWSRESKSNFPLNLRFTPHFVHFNAETSIMRTAMFATEFARSEFAFIHLYLIYVANFEEYRVTVRPEISEWFADLNEAGCHNWLIIFDSSRVKDKKVRTQIVDKLKSDFARFQNRLFESNDLSTERSVSALSSLIQSNFFASLENYSNILTTNVQKLRGTVSENTFTPSSLINDQCSLMCFYWNLGLFEMALNELNSLANFMTDSIRALAQQHVDTSSLSWLKQLRLLPLDKCCTLLYPQMFSKTASEEWSLVKIHAHLLAHQIVLSMQLLNHKMSVANPANPAEKEQQSQQSDQKSDKVDLSTDGSCSLASTDQQLNTLQIRHNSVTAILDFAQTAFHCLEEELLLLKANYSPVLLHCLFIVWQMEVFELAKHLLAAADELLIGNFDDVAASAHINFLLNKKCQAIMHLHSIIAGKQSQEFTIARRWLEQTSTPHQPTGGDKSAAAPIERIVSNFAQFSEAFCAFDAAKFEAFARRELEDALVAFRRFRWNGHVRWIEEFLAATLTSKKDDADKFKYEHSMQNFAELISGESFRLVGDLVSHLETALEQNEERMRQKDRELLFDCYLTALYLAKENEEKLAKFQSKLFGLSEQIETQMFRSNLRWLQSMGRSSVAGKKFRPIVPFPLRIARICSPTLLHCVLNRHGEVPFELELRSLLPVELPGCLLKAEFRKVTKHSTTTNLLPPNGMAFRQVTTNASDPKQNTIYNLECLLPPNKNKQSAEKNQSSGGKSAKFEAITKEMTLLPGISKCSFKINETNQNAVGCFQLHSLLVQCPSLKCSFTLDFLHEIAQNRMVEHIFCFLDVIKPSISLEEEENVSKEETKTPVECIAGIEQQFRLELCPGTLPLQQPTKLCISLVGIGNKDLRFKNLSGQWTSQSVDFEIPALESGQKHPLCIHFCMGIDRIEPATAGDESNTADGPSVHEIKLEWTRAENPSSPSSSILHRFIQLHFTPIMRLRSSTSFLAGSAIFIMDVLRDKAIGAGREEIELIPLDVSLHQEHNIALEPVEAQLLNPKPFQAIVANSAFRFVWRLPDTSIGKAVPIPHFLRLKYRARARRVGGEEEEEENAANEEEGIMLIEKRLDFPVPKVEFEVCARFYSEQSQSVLCRIEQPCDLVVSIRSLAKLVEAETVIVSIESAESEFWRCTERHKLTKVKDSGVGQVIFTIVPKILGYLPFPAISIFKYNVSDHSPSRQHSLNEKHFGEPLISFYRNRASQIHILAPLHVADETTSVGSANTAESGEQKKKSLKSQARDRLQKLFEVKG